MSISNINAVPYNTIQYISGVPILSISYINGVQTIVTPPLQYLLIGGNFQSYNAPATFRIAKINGSGNLELNSTFNPGVGFQNGAVQDIQQQPDGKYVIVGSFTQYSGSSPQANRIVRINQNGTQDNTFDVGNASGLQSIGYAISPQTNNSVIVGGGFTTYKLTSSFSIAKISPSGALDTSFNVGNGFRNTVYGLATQPDGKVIAVGTFNMYSGSLNLYTTRTDLSGSLDMGPGTTFNPGEGFSSTVNQYATQSDGKIIAVGDFTTYSGSSVNRIVRINPNGTRDTTFNVGTGFNVLASRVLVQSDEKIVVVGGFTTYSGSASSGIVRLNTDGTRDTTFNIGTGVASNQLTSVVIQSDGKYIVGGNYTTYSGSSSVRLTRINTNGTLDATFNTGAGSNGFIYATPIQSDGKIIVVGAFTSYSGSVVSNILRLNTNGTIDATFNVGTGLNSSATNAIIEPSTNKIIVVGNFTTYKGILNNSTRIIRLDTNGNRDTSFVSGTGFNQSVNTPSHLSIESDGKIYVGGGFFSTYSGSVVNCFARINPSGSLDTTFSGYMSSPSSDVGFSNTVRSIFISSSNIYFAGSYTAYRPINNIIRLNTDGTQDTSFAIGSGLTVQAFAVKLQPDGKIIIGGAFGVYSGSASSGIVRLNTDGTRDTTFNVGTGFNASVYSLDIQPDGKILTLGNFTAYSGSSVNRITRINTDGTRDTTFNIGTGIDLFLAAPSNKILASSDGGVYVSSPGTSTYSGSFTGNLWKINSNGTLNSTFNARTTVLNTPIGGFTGATQTGAYTLIESGSSIIAAGTGFTLYKDAPINRGAMIDSTGAISSSFNIGTNNDTGRGFNGTVRTWATQSDGKILAGGDFTLYSGSAVSRIARINRDGTRDASLNTGTGLNSGIFDLRVQSDGKIVAVGSFTTYSGSASSGIVRLNTDGTRDTSFNVGAGFTLSNTAAHLKIQSDGKIVVVGQFTTYSGSTANRIVRINTNGTLDSTFNTGVGFNQNVETVILQSDEKILINGNFTSYSGSAINRILRLNPNGTRDTTFNVGNGLASSGTSLALQNDGKILCASLSQTYSGSTNRYLIRINSNGTLDNTFNININSTLSQGSSTSNSLVIDNDGKIYWGNSFTTFSGSFTPNRIVRITPSGSVDETFNQAYPNYANNTGKGANGTIQAVLLL